MARAGGNAMAFLEPEVGKKRSQKLYNVAHLNEFGKLALAAIKA